MQVMDARGSRHGLAGDEQFLTHIAYNIGRVGTPELEDAALRDELQLPYLELVILSPTEEQKVHLQVCGGLWITRGNRVRAVQGAISLRGNQ